jgi:hypothetical protein
MTERKRTKKINENHRKIQDDLVGTDQMVQFLHSLMMIIMAALWEILIVHKEAVQLSVCIFILKLYVRPLFFFCKNVL